MYVQGENFTEVYKKLISHVHCNPQFICSPRKKKSKECIPVMFKIENPRDRILYVPERNFSISYMIAEALWYFIGDNSTKWISNYSKFWENISDDGSTANSAYGARIFRPHNDIANSLLIQWDYIKQELSEDKDSRRAVIHIRVPQDSISAKKDVPCTLTLQFFIREEKLHMVVDMRSSDLIRGISYDVPAFTLFQEALANQLNVELGSYSHISHSLHIYSEHWNMCENIIKSKSSIPLQRMLAMPPMPKQTHLIFKTLNTLQWDARNAYTYNELYNIITRWSHAQVDDYWKDWGYILLIHRAQKLSIPELAALSKNNIAFSGYKEFNK